MTAAALPEPNPDIVKQLDRWFARKDNSSGCSFDLEIPHYARETAKNCDLSSGSIRNRKLRIGIFTSWRFPHKGGLSTYIMTLREGLQRRGHQVDVISQDSFGHQWRPFPWMLHIQQFFKRRYGPEASDLVGPEYRLCLYEHLVAERNLAEYDILHAQDVFTANVLIRQRPRHRRPVVYSPHGIMTNRRIEMEGTNPESLAGLYFRLLDSIAATGCDSAIALYKELAEGLSIFGLTKDRTYVVPTGITKGQDSPIEKTTKQRMRPFGGPGRTVTYVGRMKDSKGPQYLLKAVEDLRARGLALRVLLVGDGPTCQYLRHRYRKRPGIEFMGWQTRSSVRHILRQSDILVIPGTIESLPVVGLEGMFAGVAIIATLCGGIPEIIHPEKTGILVPPGDVDALAEQLHRLVRDDALRKRLGKAAQAYAKSHFSLARMAAEVEAVYHRTLDPHRTSTP